jgi:hypothetical protein
LAYERKTKDDQIAKVSGETDTAVKAANESADKAKRTAEIVAAKANTAKANLQSAVSQARADEKKAADPGRGEQGQGRSVQLGRVIPLVSIVFWCSYFCLSGTRPHTGFVGFKLPPIFIKGQVFLV